MTRKLLPLLAMVTALVLSPSCDNKISTSGEGAIYVKTIGAEAYTTGDVSLAIAHGLLTSKVELIPGSDGYEYPDCGFEWSLDEKMSTGVNSVGWMDAEGESEDQPSDEWRGFRANILVLDPATKYYYRAYVKIEGEKHYGAIKSFKTPGIAVSCITLNMTSAVIKLDEEKTLQLTAEVYPEEASDLSVEWESSDESIAKVSDKGLVTAINGGNVTITASSVENPSVKATCQIKVVPKMPEGAVDMGLPSFWHKMNFGATSEYDKGRFYSWGSTSYGTNFTRAGYKYFMSNTDGNGVSYSAFKYTCDITDHGTGIKDGLWELEDSDDAANIGLGPRWHIPSKGELQELIDNCTMSTTTVGEVECVILTSKINGNKLVFPTTGRYNSFKGYEGYTDENYSFCWLNRGGYITTSGYDYATRAEAGYFRQDEIWYDTFWRSDGMPIRAVYR